MSKSVAPPSRYWAVQKDGTTVQRHVSVADRLGSLTYTIPESCSTAQLSRQELGRTTTEPSVLDDDEKVVLGL